MDGAISCHALKTTAKESRIFSSTIAKHVCTTLLRMLITLFACFFISYQLALIFIPILVLVFFITKRYLDNINAELQELYAKQAQKSENLGESLNLLPFSKYAGNFEYPYNKYVKITQNYLSSLTKYTMFTYTSQMQNVIVVSGIMSAVAFGLGGIFIIYGIITVGGLFAFQNFLFNVSGGIQGLVSMFYNFERASVSFDRISEIMSLPQEKLDIKLVENRKIKEIRLENVSLEYEGKTIFSNLNLTAKQGDRILITGIRAVENLLC